MQSWPREMLRTNGTKFKVGKFVQTLESDYGKTCFKIFPLTSSLFVFVYFLNLSCLSHRQKVSFGWSFKMLFLWRNIYKHSRFPNFAEVTAHRTQFGGLTYNTGDIWELHVISPSRGRGKTRAITTMFARIIC